MARTERQFAGVLVFVVAAVLIGGVVTAAVKSPSHKTHHQAVPSPSFPSHPSSPAPGQSPSVAPTTPTPGASGASQPPGHTTGPSGPGGTSTGPQMPNTGLPAGLPVAGGVLLGFALTTRRISRSYSGRGRP